MVEEYPLTVVKLAPLFELIERVYDVTGLPLLLVVGLNESEMVVLVAETNIGAGGGSGALAAMIDPIELQPLHPLTFLAR